MITVRAYSVDWLLHLHLRAILTASIRRRGKSAPRFHCYKMLLWSLKGAKKIKMSEDSYNVVDNSIINKNPYGKRFCKYCGKELQANAVFCSFCGRPQNKVAVQHPARPEMQKLQPAISNNSTTVVIKKEGSNGLGTAGFIFSILGLFSSWMPVVNFVIWGLGFLFSFIGLFKSPRGLAFTGLLLSLIDVFIIAAIFGSIAAILSKF